jgi:ADP-ribose pyrophosphatase YjhB (NUDIX family)
VSARTYPDRPWVGVGVVVWRGDEVLLVRRGRPPRQGEWGIPGGAQALGETVFAAAIREVLEETGLTVRPTAIVTVVDSISPDADGRVAFHYTLVEVSAEWVAGEAAAADDVDDVRWAAAGAVGDWVRWDETVRVVEAASRLRAGQLDAGQLGAGLSPFGAAHWKSPPVP